MIPKEFTKTSEINNELNKIIDYVTEHWEVDDIKWDTWEFEIQTNEETGNPFSYDIAETFDEEYNLLISQEKYFFGCPFNIYHETYSNRLKRYLEENKLDLYTESHFIKEELKFLKENHITHYLNHKTIEKLSVSLERQKEFLLERKKILNTISLDTNQNIIVKKNKKDEVAPNPHPRIFSCTNSYYLFEAFREYVRDEKKLADYSFIYRKMQVDSLIYKDVGDSEFRKFLYDNYNVDIEKTKQLNNCKGGFKIDIYSNLKDQYKPY